MKPNKKTLFILSLITLCCLQLMSSRRHKLRKRRQTDQKNEEESVKTQLDYSKDPEIEERCELQVDNMEIPKIPKGNIDIKKMNQIPNLVNKGRPNSKTQDSPVQPKRETEDDYYF